MSRPRLILPVRLPLLVAVFVVGLGIGAVAIAVSHHQRARHVIVTRTIAGPGPDRKPPTTATSSTSSSRPTLHPRRKSTVAPELAPSFAALESRLSGSVGIAVAPLGAGPIQTFGTAQIAHAWSTSKVPVLVTLLVTDEQLNHGLSPAGREEATLALTESDNAAVEALFSSLEQLRGGLVPASEAVQEMFRMAGDRTAMVNTAPNNEGFTTYGQSEWSLSDEIIFYRALARGCLLDANDTATSWA